MIEVSSPICERDKLIENPVIIVHPYYDMPYSRRKVKNNIKEFDRLGIDELKEIWKHVESYMINLEKLIEEHNGPLITFEESKRLKKTAAHYESLGRLHNTYFVRTKADDPTPKGKMTWDDVIEFLGGFQGPFMAVGGQLKYDEGDPGCLGYAIQKLSPYFDIKPQEGLTFE